MADEFALIEKYLRPLSSAIGDDCAVLPLAAGEVLVTSVDTVVEGVHFYPDIAPQELAFRAVSTALSDLAAAGAQARAITLALTLPAAQEACFADFSRGLAQVLQHYSIELIGGDTTRGPLTITVQALGSRPQTATLGRGGAQPGDKLYVSGSTGDAAAWLRMKANHRGLAQAHQDYLSRRYYRPQARLDLAAQLLAVASSAIDISDGLLADAQHLCDRSGVGIRVDETQLPLSAALTSACEPDEALELALTGGDDYELLFTVAPQHCTGLPVGCVCIGEVIAGSGVECGVLPQRLGYAHFDASVAVETSTAGSNPAQVDTPSDDAVQPQPFSSTVQFFAFGFGSGLAPVAPGTAGTLLAIPLYLLFSDLPLALYTLLVVVAAAVGISLCGKASRQLQVHDHPGIVWDEFVGFWITMWAVPVNVWTVVLGFALFRLLDIAKPWPISWCDRHISGGFGIMVDDILAGVFSCIALHALLLFVL